MTSCQDSSGSLAEPKSALGKIEKQSDREMGQSAAPSALRYIRAICLATQRAV